MKQTLLRLFLFSVVQIRAARLQGKPGKSVEAPLKPTCLPLIKANYMTKPKINQQWNMLFPTINHSKNKRNERILSKYCNTLNSQKWKLKDLHTTYHKGTVKYTCGEPFESLNLTKAMCDNRCVQTFSEQTENCHLLESSPSGNNCPSCHASKAPICPENLYRIFV